ncbi:MAG: hypothetical protein K5663_10205 [Clostridiales bacterium]|nr:hypothetical protein [Clostridiales bacterium]
MTAFKAQPGKNCVEERSDRHEAVIIIFHSENQPDGRQVVRPDTLFRIADALEIRPSELVRLAEDEKTNTLP